MALVVSAAPALATPLDPTAALQTALTNFEGVLTTEQKRKFDDQVQNYGHQKPDAWSAVRFTAQIDAENHSKTRMSVSHRLCTFLDATRQFTAIVDTFTSSNPAIAALVWGGVKTAILVVSNVASYFDKVTKIIMTVGRMCPVYHEFSHLYGDSTALQQALCDYYAVVVRLVTKIVQVSQRTVVTSVLSAIVSPFESEFGPFQTELAEASQLVDSQVSLASKQAAQASARLIELESRDSRQHRRFVSKFISDSRAEHDATRQMRRQESARRAAKMKLYIRDQLSTVNHQTSWKQAHKQRLVDTAEWFRGEQQFQAWETDRDTATLWCPGRMGVGKTVLVSNIVASLHTSLPAGDVVAYHFCRSDDAASLSARNILGALARQILDKHIEDADGDQLRSLQDACRASSADGVIDLLLPRLEVSKTYYIIVDGLDECPHDQLAMFATSMAKLCEQRGRRIKVLYSGRPELEHQLFPQTGPTHRLPLSKSKVNADIERYIETELDHGLEQGRIKLVNPEVILKIRDTLHAEHDGLLLFVRLFIDELYMLGSENAILRALDEPPRKISDLLAKSVRRVQTHSLAADAMRVLRYCGCTKRPLTVDEFGELLSLSVSQTSLDRASIPQNMDQIIAACGGLVYVEEEEATVHYVHHCVKRHLFTDSETRQEGFVESETDTYLGCLCLTYLSFNDFKRQLHKAAPTSKTLVTPLELGLGSIRNSSKAVNEVARKLLQVRRSSHRLTTAELSRRTEEILGQVESSRLREELQSRPFCLLEYVRSHWVSHSSRFQDDFSMWYRFATYVRGGNDLARRPWILDGDGQPRSETKPPTSVAWALAHNHAALLLCDVLHESCVLLINEKVDILQYAITTENYHLAQSIMDARHRTTEMTQNGLRFTVHYGHEKFLGLFIDVGADINAVEFGEQTTLQAAAERGHLGVVEQLLAAGADVNAAGAGTRGLTALEAAAEGGHLAIVERLLVAGADVNAAAANRGRAALRAAAEGGHLGVVERLLAAGADVNTTSEYIGRTALQAAAEEGHIGVVERLLAAGADVNTTGEYTGRTALQAAAEGGYLDVVERLLAVGADVNAAIAEYGGRTALQAAAEEGHLSVVERLLAARADVNAAAGIRGLTALQAAAKKGHLGVVERLLAAGADVNAATSIEGLTALEAATEAGHLDVVERLKLAGARK